MYYLSGLVGAAVALVKIAFRTNNPTLEANRSRDLKRSCGATTRTSNASTTIVFVYLAGCAGLRDLVRGLSLQVYKFGVTHSLDSRMEWLGETQYAACSKTAAGQLTRASGFDLWRPQKLTARTTRPGSPVTILACSLKVVLPPSLTGFMFDARLRRALARDATFQGFKDARFTLRSDGRVHRATELIAIRPRHAASIDHLIMIIEEIVAASA